MPILDEVNAVSKETPVFILHLYDRALLNRAALNAIGYDKDTKEIPGTSIQRDKSGNPTGMLIANPNAIILYSALAQGPKLNLNDQRNSTLHFMRELNRLGITSVIDAGGGFQNYPDDYTVIDQLNKDDKLTVRIAYNLFTQKPNHELDDFENWVKTTISDRSIERVKALGGGIAIQNRMAFQGEYYVEKYGKENALHTPPINRES